MADKNLVSDIFDRVHTGEIFSSKSNVKSSSWDWSIPSWVWYTGAAILTVGVLYLGYNLYSDYMLHDLTPSVNKGKAPMYPIDPSSSKGVTPGVAPDVTPTIPDVTPTIPDITLNDNRTPHPVSYLLERLNGARRTVTNLLNPFSYFNTSVENDRAFAHFMEVQNDPVRAHRGYYPFTVNNPMAPWYKKLSIALFGESYAQEQARLHAKSYAERIWEVIRVKTNFTSGSVTPMIGQAGIGINSPDPAQNAWSHVHNIILDAKLSAIKSAETIVSNKDLPAHLVADVTAWSEPVASTSTEVLDKANVSVAIPSAEIIVNNTTIPSPDTLDKTVSSVVREAKPLSELPSYAEVAASKIISGTAVAPENVVETMVQSIPVSRNTF